jgi:hypothetical protein
MPSPPTVYKWQAEDAEFADKVGRAREAGVEVLLDQTVEIADESCGARDLYIEYREDGVPIAKVDGDVIQRAKLRAETRFKYAQMIAPRKYGAKLDVTSGGEKLAAPAQLNDMRIQSLIHVAQQRAQLPPPEIEDLMS